MLPISQLLLTHGSTYGTIMYQLFLHIGGDGEAHLSQLLQDVGRSSLCTALHSGYLGGGKWHNAAAEEQSRKGVRKHVLCLLHH